MKQMDYNKFLKRVTYKPNFSMFAYPEGPNNLWVLRVTAYVENSRKEFVPWKLEQPPYEDDFYYDFMRKPPTREGVGYLPRREVIEVRGVYRIPRTYPGEEESFLDWLMAVLHGFERHEMQEWFRLDGELVYDPHKEVGSREA